MHSVNKVINSWKYRKVISLSFKSINISLSLSLSVAFLCSTFRIEINKVDLYGFKGGSNAIKMQQILRVHSFQASHRICNYIKSDRHVCEQWEQKKLCVCALILTRE